LRLRPRNRLGDRGGDPLGGGVLVLAVVRRFGPRGGFSTVAGLCFECLLGLTDRRKPGFPAAQILGVSDGLWKLVPC
jgi:hypothetical protein